MNHRHISCILALEGKHLHKLFPYDLYIKIINTAGEPYINYCLDL